MKHWDLRPGETVELFRGSVPDGRRAGLLLKFLFRTTILAVFEDLSADGPRLREFYLDEDGRLFDSLRQDGFAPIRRHWVIAGDNRNSRTILSEPLGHRSNLSVASVTGLARLAKRAGASL